MDPTTRPDTARIEQELQDADAARPQDPARLAAALEAAVEADRPWPEAERTFVMSELLGELSEAYEALDRPDDALRVMEEAIAAGYRGEPDPRCRLAEIHLRFDDPEPAHRIFAEVRADTPDDVWLYNNAGLEYGHAGDHPRALEWLTEGLELALRTGDPERLVAQLSGLRRASLRALGREQDDLERRADAFLAAPPPPPPRWPTPLSSSTAAPPPDSSPANSSLAFAWFPGEEFPLALETWPEIAEAVGTDHREYSRGLQRQLLLAAAARRAEGGPLAIGVAPLRVAAYVQWCGAQGQDPAEPGARARYAAECARTSSPDVIAWPPGRNQLCWCGSGRKYKHCCGQVHLG